MDSTRSLPRPQCTAERRCYHGRVIEVIEQDLTLPSGKKVTHATVRHPGAVVIMAQRADGQILLLRQYRQSIGGVILELPAGTLETGEKPLACAMREIVEETGMSAGSWTPLGEVYPAPGFCDERQFLYLARDLSSARGTPDEDEIFTVVPMSVPEIENAVISGELSDAKSIATFARARLRGLV